jgi:hypothetical protein
VGCHSGASHCIRYRQYLLYSLNPLHSTLMPKPEELKELIKLRVDNSFGFRGQVENVMVSNPSQHRLRNTNIKRQEP